jgi:hypothetical protein
MIGTKVVDEMVIWGRPLHAQPPIPRYFYTVVGSQNTYNHDLGRKWTQYTTSDVTFLFQQCAPEGDFGY